jgi:DNA-binding LacI/PurR family transcriptional regulator
MVGVVGRFAPEIAELLVPYIIGRALEHALAADKGISLRYFDCFRNETHSVSFVDGAVALLSEDVDVLCVISPDSDQVDGIMAAARRAGKPVVFVTEAQLPQPVAQVYIDNRYDGYQAGNYLLDAGYREVTFVMLGRHEWALDRLAGVRDAFRHFGLPAEAVRVFPAESAEGVAWKRREFKESLQSWVRGEMDAGRLVGAVVAANDHVALDILEAADAHRGEKPRGFVILGFDDKPEAIRSGLTSFRPPLFDMGQEGARLLSHILQNGDLRGTSLHSRLASQLVARASTAPTA